jgi:hypothetical protein
VSDAKHASDAKAVSTSISRRSIGPSEQFMFTVTGTNSGEPDGIRLVDVRYHIVIANTAVANLIVPATNPDGNGTRYKSYAPAGGGIILNDLPSNAQVSEMYVLPRVGMSPEIVPPLFEDLGGELNVGDSDTMIIMGLAGLGSTGGLTKISCR